MLVPTSIARAPGAVVAVVSHVGLPLDSPAVSWSKPSAAVRTFAGQSSARPARPRSLQFPSLRGGITTARGFPRGNGVAPGMALPRALWDAA